ncbi:MAG TPA: DUF4469 domain-containing protein [Spirochaetes bacterium]|nr:DUF4469 domain-containing protein [Spirochaetota bacterium]
MPINYYLRENPLTTPTSFSGKVDETLSYNTDLIIQSILNRGSTVTKADVQAVITDLIEVVLDALSKGARINIEGLVQLYPSVEGIFTTSSDSFDPLRHKLNIGTRTSEQLKKRLRGIASVSKQATPPIIPQVNEVIDTINNNINTSFTMTRVININGERLKFDNSRADEGVFIVNDTLISETQIAANLITSSSDLKIAFQGDVTGTAGNSVRVEVRSRMGNSLTYPLKIATSVSLTLA